MYGLVDELDGMETEMIGMKPNDVIKIERSSSSQTRKLSSRRGTSQRWIVSIPIAILVKNMMIKDAEQPIDYGLRELID